MNKQLLKKIYIKCNITVVQNSIKSLYIFTTYEYVKYISSVCWDNLIMVSCIAWRLSWLEILPHYSTLDRTWQESMKCFVFER